jgi:hypothetical protein
VVSFTPWPLYTRGKSPRYALDTRLGGHQNRYGRRGEKKNLIPIGTRTPTMMMVIMMMMMIMMMIIIIIIIIIIISSVVCFYGKGHTIIPTETLSRFSSGTSVSPTNSYSTNCSIFISRLTIDAI